MCVFAYSCCVCFFFFKQKTAYEMRISDWSSDVCSSDLGLQLRRGAGTGPPGAGDVAAGSRFPAVDVEARLMPNDDLRRIEAVLFAAERPLTRDEIALYMPEGSDIAGLRSEEHTSELQSLMRISYAGFCLKKKKTRKTT